MCVFTQSLLYGPNVRHGQYLSMGKLIYLLLDWLSNQG